jgi:biotin carboxyl carrier protein
MKLNLCVGEETREVRVLRRGGQLRVTFEDGRTIEARLLAAGGGVFELEIGHARIHGAGAVTGSSERQVWINGRTLGYTRLQPGGGGGREADAGALSVSIPAVVVEVLVAVGDAVEVGQKLILLESMKMVLPVQATHAGTVRAIFCAVGEAVQPGVPLVELG